MRQMPLPPELATAPPAELQERIGAARARLGERLVILGHHYQREEVIRHADFRGDCRTFGPGDYPQLGWLSNQISSGRRISNDYPYNAPPAWR